MNYLRGMDSLEKKVIITLLSVKDSLVRISVLQQGLSAVDRGIHTGGAMSAVLPMTTLYYSGVMNIDTVNPTARQDLFVLSKGHAVATMAAIYADLGYFDKSVLDNSRSVESILNGHPGPLLPGVHIPTGPMGQGICVAQGFALAGRGNHGFDVYTLTGDGELQEGTLWEGVMYAGAVGLDNLCVLVDRNHGQLDNPYDNVFPMKEPEAQFAAFGFRVLEVPGDSYGPLLAALEEFKFGSRDGRPTAVIINCRKGQGSFGSDFIKHKLTLDPQAVETEIALQERRLEYRKEEVITSLHNLMETEKGRNGFSVLRRYAEKMNIQIDLDKNGVPAGIKPIEVAHIAHKAPRRDKSIFYDERALPRPKKGEQYRASDIVTGVMKAAAMDSRIISIDSDLSSTSGLFDGIAAVDRTRALNVGIAEANMMCIGEAYACLGYNAWVSTFCPFFNWNVLRRIAINQQERNEVIAQGDGWLSEGHSLDLTFLATAANLDTQTNGATHMGNDDLMFFREMGSLKIIDVSCPVQLVEIMKWILSGNRGLVYVRIMRAASGVIYDDSFTFDFGKGYFLRNAEKPQAYILSSGRGVHEALEAGEILLDEGFDIEVIDMPSLDEKLICNLAKGKKPVLFAEQNNGYLWTSAANILFRNEIKPATGIFRAVNTSGKDGELHFIHSGTYTELTRRFSLSAEQLAGIIKEMIEYIQPPSRG